MIEIKNLSVKYKSNDKDFLALDRINITIENGDICAVIGPSGCGKSTLLYVLSGVIKDYEGSVLIDGNPINPSLHRIGLVMQNYGLLPWKSVYYNAIAGSKIKDGKDNIDRMYVDYILKKLGLNKFAHRHPGELSGGQRQRIAIARAFILKPSLLLMDEPFSALDEIIREEMQDLFLKIWFENRVSTLFITHSIDEALYIGKKIAILSPSPGRVKEIYVNPLFGKKDLRLNEDYYKFSIELRKKVRESWLR
ncbi:ABC transporter ATP-binding protein [Fonticella tunisiensis]|uniref:NitT/TauT family transport system ATP-binding protein n=1 Tax=Fonticella tunisiensis TaxID=1096341 RepID=A0A4R7KPD0_9CLOT|nr:ABC transporter ATP-binding protein [Fonticella tunisiensis]TDT60989.1 NitT/TauT family transport system ATP-binding protein [Fonticella tunisiensis]